MDFQSAPIVIIAGPTAVGKTEISIILAQKINAEIISADSRQIYEELNIAVAKPNSEELKQIRHHFISEISIKNEFTAADFKNRAIKRIEEINKRNKNVIITGGTGLYLKSLISGLDEIPSAKKSLRASLNKDFEENGIGALQEKLHPDDYKNFNNSDLNNSKRVIRALEVYLSTGKSLTSYRGKTKGRAIAESIDICLVREKEQLNERINERVEKMFQTGLVEEAKGLFKYRDLPALKTVGYNELFDFFNKKCSLEEAKENIKMNTRRYSKKQITWFKNQHSFIFLNQTNYISKEQLVKDIIQLSNF